MEHHPKMQKYKEPKVKDLNIQKERILWSTHIYQCWLGQWDFFVCFWFCFVFWSHPTCIQGPSSIADYGSTVNLYCRGPVSASHKYFPKNGYNMTWGYTARLLHETNFNRHYYFGLRSFRQKMTMTMCLKTSMQQSPWKHYLKQPSCNMSVNSPTFMNIHKQAIKLKI